MMISAHPVSVIVSKQHGFSGRLMPLKLQWITLTEASKPLKMLFGTAVLIRVRNHSYLLPQRC